MKTKVIAEIIQNLDKNENFPTLDVANLIDEKVESDMEKVIERIDAQFKLVLWVIGIGFSMTALLLTLYKFIG